MSGGPDVDVAGSPFLEKPSFAPYLISDVVPHETTRIIARDPLTAETDAPLWGYCLTFPRYAPAGPDEVIQIVLQCRQGTVGVGLLEPGLQFFVDTAEVVSSEEPARVVLLVGAGQLAGPLVVRNVSDSPAHFEVLSVTGYRLRKPIGAAALPPAPDGPLRPISQWHRYYGDFAMNAEEKVRAHIYRELDRPTVMQWTADLRVVIHPGDELSRSLFVSGAYEPSTAILLRRLLRPAQTFIDVGANIGVFTILAAKWVGALGRVYAFEPSSREFESLAQNIALNGFDNVFLSHSAVHERSGTATLHVAGGRHRGQSTLADEFAYAGVEAEKTERIALTVLDDFMVAHAIDRVHVMKIDAEGAEASVLKGAARLLARDAPILVFECNDRLLESSGSSRQQLWALIESHDYELFGIRDDGPRLAAIADFAVAASENFVALPRRRALEPLW